MTSATSQEKAASAASDQVTIPRDEYDELRERSIWLDALEAAGVDNWQGIDFAADLFRDMRKDSEES